MESGAGTNQASTGKKGLFLLLLKTLKIKKKFRYPPSTYNTPSINKEMKVKLAHTSSKCYPGYPFGDSACSPFPAEILGSTVGMPCCLLTQPPQQGNHQPEPHLDRLKRDRWLPQEWPLLGAGTVTRTTPSLTGVFQHCVLLFKKTTLFIFGIASWE